MKKYFVILTMLGSIALFSISTAKAADYYGHGYGGHASYGHHVQGYGHGFAPSSYGRGAYNGNSGGHYQPRPTHHGYSSGYGQSTYGNGHRYSQYGHGGGVRISTPHFGIRIGH